jgi:metallo-beta-lactamase class B
MQCNSLFVIRNLAALTAACAGLCACNTTTTFNDKPSAASVDAYVADATRLAGNELKPLLQLCRPQPAVRAGGHALEDVVDRLMALPAPQPGQAFDNLYFIASGWVTAWVLKTSEGLVLIDALNNSSEAKELIEGGMVKLGLDPAQIKYIVVTHAHGDHYGGVSYLVDKYKARVIASEQDWRQMTQGPLEFAYRGWDAPPKRDITVADGDRIDVGDTSITFYVTPGHTLGTLSPMFNVRSDGRSHKVLLWGGTAFNFGKDIPRLESYIAGTDRLARIARQMPIDVLVSNHAIYDGVLDKAKSRAERTPGAPNPFVIGSEAVDRSLQVMGTCGRAQRDRFLLM